VNFAEEGLSLYQQVGVDVYQQCVQILFKVEQK